MKKKRILAFITIVFLIGISAYLISTNTSTSISFTSPLSQQIQQKIKPLEKYTFENLRAVEPEKASIILEEVISQETGFTSHLFSFISEGKRITGQINIPKDTEPAEGFPVVLMLRGYIDPEFCSTGDGTRNAAAVFASNGFITMAPDFLGCGGSDDPDENSITARLHRPYNLLVLINSLSSLPQASQRLGLWGHSNGGQIALSLLEITGKNIPTVLWAPVSKPFPYSILYYTDEYDDRGKAIRKVIAQFEQDYDVDKYSIHQDYDQISAPLQIHQGTLDDAVPKDWTDELVETLEDLEKDVEYFVYPGADHNLRPSWNTVIQRNINFFNSYIDQ